MKNRSKILSPRQSQIRREISDTAEYAATGFSSLYSSTKSQLQKVVSKISKACDSVVNLVFPKADISVQQRDLYTFRLDSISNVIKNPLPGPKPLHSDTATMPPTPGRFTNDEDIQPGKKVAYSNEKPQYPRQEKPKFGIPLWKQFVCKDPVTLESENKRKNSSEKKNINLSFDKSPEFNLNFNENKGPEVEVKNSVQISNIKEDSTGKPSVVIEKVNPNSTPIGHHGKERKSHVFVKIDSPKNEDSECKIKEQLDNTPQFWRSLEDKPSEIKSAGEPTNESSLLDITPEYKSEEKKLKNSEPSPNASKIEKTSLYLEPEAMPIDTTNKNVVESQNEVKKVIGFFVPDNEKVMPEFEEGFICSGSTSKSSTPSVHLLKSKEEVVQEEKNIFKVNPPEIFNPFESKSTESNNLKSINPFTTVCNDRLEKTLYEFGSKDKKSEISPAEVFVSRPHNGNYFNQGVNPFVSPQDNIDKTNSKESNQGVSMLDNSVRTPNNPFAVPSSGINPFSQSNGPPFALTPYPNKPNESIKNPFEQKSIISSNPSSASNPMINKLEDKQPINPFSQLNLPQNPFNTVETDKAKQESQFKNPFLPTSHLNNLAQNISHSGPANLSSSNPFKHLDQGISDSALPSSGVGAGMFNIGTIPQRTFLKGKRPGFPK